MRYYQPDGWVDAGGNGHAHFLGELHGTTYDTTSAIAQQDLFSGPQNRWCPRGSKQNRPSPTPSYARGFLYAVRLAPSVKVRLISPIAGNSGPAEISARHRAATEREASDWISTVLVQPAVFAGQFLKRMSKSISTTSTII